MQHVYLHSEQNPFIDYTLKHADIECNMKLFSLGQWIIKLEHRFLRCKSLALCNFWAKVYTNFFCIQNEIYLVVFICLVFICKKWRIGYFSVSSIYTLTRNFLSLWEYKWRAETKYQILHIHNICVFGCCSYRHVITTMTCRENLSNRLIWLH